MIKINGEFNSALVYTDILEQSAKDQIERLCNMPFVKGCKIRIMPDVHAGAGCVIGFTADLGEMVIPNIVGVDIGCGMLTVELGKNDIDFATLDDTIRKYIPSGRNVHDGRFIRVPELLELNCYRDLKRTKWIERSVGTLGGGNHFIEIDIDDAGNKYLVIHTGSRNLGKQVAEHYQRLAYDVLRGMDTLFEECQRVIVEYKAQGRRKEIESKLKQLKAEFHAKGIDTPPELAYLTGQYRQMYLDDMKICQEFAIMNRFHIARIILEKAFGMDIDTTPHFETIHNYVDIENNIIRKGAVSAKKDEILLIPINMRDGSLICRGKGNEEWNCSAPHGAGRLFSRAEANRNFSVEEFKKSMEGIYTTSVNQFTVDECPMAYKSMEDIVKYIEPTVEILKVIKPLYNFKASE